MKSNQIIKKLKLNTVSVFCLMVLLSIFSGGVNAEEKMFELKVNEENIESLIEENENIANKDSNIKLSDIVTLIGIFVTLTISLITLVFQLINNNRNRFVNAVTTERVRWIGELKELISEYLALTTFYQQKPFLEGEALEKYFERIIYLMNKIKLHLNYIDKKDQEIIDLIEKINNKLFGIYDIKELLVLPKEKRFEALSEDNKQKYISRALKKLGKEKVQLYIKNQDQEVLMEIIELFINEINNDLVLQYGYKGRDELILYTNSLVEKSRRYLKDEWEKVKEEAGKGKVKKKKS